MGRGRRASYDRAGVLIDLSLVSKQVPWRYRSRGRKYVRAGAVRIVRGDEQAVNGRVAGAVPGEVSLRRDADELVGSCSCPVSAGQGLVCPHIWATLLAASREGALTGAPAARRPCRIRNEPVPSGGASAIPERAAPSAWREQLGALRKSLLRVSSAPPRRWLPEQEIVYLVDVAGTVASGSLRLELWLRSGNAATAGGLRALSAFRLPVSEIAGLPDPADREVLSLLVGASRAEYGAYGGQDVGRAYQLSPTLPPIVVPLLAASGRCLLSPAPGIPAGPIAWDDGEPWRLALAVRGRESSYVVAGVLRRGTEEMSLQEPVVLLPGVVFTAGTAARLDDALAFEWISFLRREPELCVPAEAADELLGALVELPRLPPLELPARLRYQEVPGVPRPQVVVRQRVAPDAPGLWGPSLRAEIRFDYDGALVSEGSRSPAVWNAARRTALLRDRAAEAAAAARLLALGFKEARVPLPEGRFELAPAALPRVVPALLAEGFTVEAEGRRMRAPGAFRLEVKSGVDWFELRGGLAFGSQQATLPALLAAIRRGDETVALDDGSVGFLPEDWLRKHRFLVGAGQGEGNHLVYKKSQAGLLDLLLGSVPEARGDAAFARLRDKLRDFSGVKPIDPGPGFKGALREYQREGLGWLAFLERFGLGGCLADDMGLGKTVQVLAHLASRRGRGGSGRRRRRPSLVVAPRSLVFHWKAEAARFAPDLSVLDHTRHDRRDDLTRLERHDLVVVTYGVLRRDAERLGRIAFDYCILDEAQAIKNPDTDTARAARRIQARHRLALSGTPVENHLGELWSLFEFLNPGMLGRAPAFARAGARGHEIDDETRRLLARALRPFLLRRTKDAVAKELPEKLEETIWCELEPRQRKLYDELRDHYRGALLGSVDRLGIGRARIQILTALLRLRQAACHPGLIDPALAGESSAKLEALLGEVSEVLEEGHKALVFSQFTSLLAIVRRSLDQRGISYAYLDGRTRDREARVRCFQEDPACRLFLISLKAGGLGLNLTAADYVFLLDPWWNPAVEAQAIDRAHRIGQRRPVFAYRLIARDTIEEKVVELQESKRALADAIITADRSQLGSLGREELELLLS